MEAQHWVRRGCSNDSETNAGLKIDRQSMGGSPVVAHSHYCLVRGSVGTMDTTQLLKGALDLVVLAVLNEDDGYGYDVVRRLRAAGLDEVGDASVYGTLRRLYASGALISYVVPSDEGPHRKYYGITPLGRSELKLQREDWGLFTRAIDRLVDHEATDDPGRVS